MRKQSAISRRHMLAVAAGGIVMSGGIPGAWAQTGPRIEKLAPELDRIIATTELIKELATGFGGPLGPAEGPLWWKESGYLLFSDIHNNRRMKHEAGRGASVVMAQTTRA